MTALANINDHNGPFSEAVTFGPCWHGQIIPGTPARLQLPNGDLQTTQAVSSPSIHYIKFAGLPPAPEPSAADLAAGRRLYDDAIEPQGKALNLGDQHNLRHRFGWKYRAPDGAVYRLALAAVDTTHLDVIATRQQPTAGVGVVVATITNANPGAFDNPQQREISPSPDGSVAAVLFLPTSAALAGADEDERAMVAGLGHGISEATQTRRLLENWAEITVTGGSMTAAPTVTVAWINTPSSSVPVDQRMALPTWTGSGGVATCAYVDQSYAEGFSARILAGVMYDNDNRRRVIEFLRDESDWNSDTSGEAAGTVTPLAVNALTSGVTVLATHGLRAAVLCNGTAVIDHTMNFRYEAEYHGARHPDLGIVGVTSYRRLFADDFLYSELIGTPPPGSGNTETNYSLVDDAVSIGTGTCVRMSNNVFAMLIKAWDDLYFPGAEQMKVLDGYAQGGHHIGEFLGVPEGGGGPLWAAFNPRTKAVSVLVGGSWL